MKGNGQSPNSLLAACLRGDEAEVIELLKNGVIQNIIDDDGKTPLALASEHGHVAVVRALIASGANVNQASRDGLTPLLRACHSGHAAVAEALLAAGADVHATGHLDGSSALYMAADFKPLAHTQAQPQAHADADSQAGASPASVVHVAPDQIGTIKLLLEHGVPVDKANMFGHTPLTAAVGNLLPTPEQARTFWHLQHTPGAAALPLEELTRLRQTGLKVIELLLDAGADVNIGYAGVHWGSGPPLHAAAALGHQDVVALLLERGAKINALSKDAHSPLAEAASRNNIDIVAQLIAAGAHVNMHKNVQRYTALHRACMYSFTQVVSMLLEAGAKTDTLDAWRRDALMLCVCGADPQSHRGSEFPVPSLNQVIQTMQLLLTPRARDKERGEDTATTHTSASPISAGGPVPPQPTTPPQPAADGEAQQDGVQAASSQAQEHAQIPAGSEPAHSPGHGHGHGHGHSHSPPDINAVRSKSGQTLLHVAAALPTEAVAVGLTRFLLARPGINVEGCPGGGQACTPLAAAVARGHEEVARLLLEAGADWRAVGVGTDGRDLRASMPSLADQFCKE